MGNPEFSFLPAENQALFRILAETTSAAILILQNGQIRYANHTAEELTGYSIDQLQAMQFWQLAAPSYQEVLRTYGMGNTWAPNLPIRYELKIRAETGVERWLDLTAAPMPNSGENNLLVTAFDITQREEAERELRHSKEDLETRVEDRTRALAEAHGRLEAVLRSLPVGVWIADAQGYIVEKNEIANQIWGGGPTPERVADFQNYTAWWAETGQPVQPEEWGLARAINSGEVATSEVIDIRRFDGQPATILTSSAPIHTADGTLIGAVAVQQDITRQRELERHESRRADTMADNITRVQMLANLSQAFAEAGLETPAVLNTIVRQVSESSGDACVVYLLGEEGYILEPAAFYHPDPEALEELRAIARGLRHRYDEGAVGSVFQTGDTLMLIDQHLEHMSTMVRPEMFPWLEKFPVSCGLFIPLRTQGRKLGVISLLRHGERPHYTPADQLFYQDLSDRAALAIENARLYAQESNRAREMEALHRATTAMLSTLDLDTLLSQILDAAQHAIPVAEQGTLHLLERETGNLEIRAASVFRDLRIQKVSLSRLEGHIARAVSERNPLLIHDHLAGTPGVTDGRGIRSAVIAPLTVGDQVLGVLSLIHSRPGQFTLADLRLLVSFAATATAALQNATLYAEVQRLATTDTLTGLLNRRRFFELGLLEMDRFRRFGHPLAAIMLDVDNLKQTNDTYGHAAGDRLLQSLADRCRSTIRRVDVMGRYGGDEFALLLPETELEAACEAAERIRNVVEMDRIWTEQGAVTTTISVGVAVACEQTVSLADLLALADSALYHAKQMGRNRVESAPL